MAGQSPFPNVQDTYRITAVDVPFVEEYVAEACAYYRGYDHVDEEYAEPPFGSAFMFEDACHDLVAYDKTDGKH